MKMMIIADMIVFVVVVAVAAVDVAISAHYYHSSDDEYEYDNVLFYAENIQQIQWRKKRKM
jgi:hypothetical protein